MWLKDSYQKVKNSCHLNVPNAHCKSKGGFQDIGRNIFHLFSGGATGGTERACLPSSKKLPEIVKEK